MAKRVSLTALIVLLCSCTTGMVRMGPAPPPPSARLLYGTDSALDALFWIDANGVANIIGDLAGAGPNPPASFTTPVAMAIRPFDEAIFVWSNSGSPRGNEVLAVVDPCNGVASEVGPSNTSTVGGGMGAIAFAPDGRLYGFGQKGPMGDNDLSFFEIDSISGVPTLIAAMPGVRVNGADFHPALTSVLYAATSEKLLKVNTTTGAITEVGSFSPTLASLGVGVMASIVFDPVSMLLKGVAFNSSTQPNASLAFDISVTNAAVTNTRTMFAAQGLGYSRGRPCPSIPDRGWRGVVGHGHYACALSYVGFPYCWGTGPDYLVAGTPTRVAATAFTALYAGGNHVCGITTAGVTECWGSNLHGQLGRTGTVSSSVPVPMSSPRSFTSLAGGGEHTCGLEASGTAYCWGRNDSGQLGDGNTTDSPSPVPVSGGLTFSAMAAGIRHTCGISIAGPTYCWGANDEGQLGDGTGGAGMQTITPAPISGGHQFASLSAGFDTNCGLTAAGAAFCWGANWAGGVGSHSSQQCASGMDCTPVPTAVSGQFSFASIDVGGGQTCALTPKGFALCWGLGRDYLGIGPNVPSCPAGSSGYQCTFDPRPVYYGLDFVSMMTADGFSCGARANGVIYCWGATWPNLGDGATVTSDRPIAIKNHP